MHVHLLYSGFRRTLDFYEILEERGLEVYLVNARHTKNLPGRKSDVQESQWLLKLHTCGLLNIQLANVISDLNGVTGQMIVRAVVAGERDPRKLAELSHPRIQASRGE